MSDPIEYEAGILREREELKRQIEAFLLEAGGWVSTEEICIRFEVRERQLRDLDDIPGLCTEFAISRSYSGGGYKHIRNATTTEWLRFKHGSRRHGIGELRRVAKLDRKRHEAVRVTRDLVYETDSGQVLLAV